MKYLKPSKKTNIGSISLCLLTLAACSTTDKIRYQTIKALTDIFNNKYAGAQEKQSKTLFGLWAKLEDHWTNFQMLIMQTGAFDWLKGKLQFVLDQLDKMSKNGELQKWAEDIGSIIKEVIQGFWAFGEKLLGIVQNVATFARENKGAIATIVQWGAILGSSLTVLGAFSMVLSFALYPIARLIYSFAHLTKLNQAFTNMIKNQNGEVRKINKSWFSYKTTLNTIRSTAKKAKNSISLLGLATMTKIKGLPSVMMTFLGKLKTFSFWLKGLKGIVKIALSPLRLALSAIGLLFSPIGLAIAGISLAGIALYKNWEKVKAFFGGFWSGLKEGLAPVLEKFTPLGDLFSIVVGWIEKAVKWVMDLISPADESAENLDKAAEAGKAFGLAFATAIDFITTPLQWLVDTLKWISENIPDWNTITQGATDLGNKAEGWLSEKWQNTKSFFGFDENNQNELKPRWSGGFTGHGGKYAPAGINEKRTMNIYCPF